jgi:putative ATP-binding cassette transporter
MSGATRQSMVFTRKILRLIATHGRGALLIASGIGVISGLATAGSIALIHAALRGTVQPSPGQFALFTALCLVVPLSRMLSQYLLLHRSLQAMLQLVMELIGRVFATPLRRLEEIGPTRILTALTRDVPTLTDTVSAVPNVLLQGTVLLGCTIYLAWLHPASAVLFVAVMILAIWGTLAAVRRSAAIQRRTRADADELFAHFRGHLSGIKELQLNWRRQADFFADLRATGDSYRRNHVAGEMAYTASSSGFQLVFMLPIGVVVLLIAPMLHIPPVEVGAYALVLLYMNGPIGSLSGLVQTFGRGAVALANIEDLGLALHAARPLQALPETTEASWERIDLVGITHAYAGEEGSAPFVLGPIDLHFQRGELVFITGGNGSGKTTLAKVLCGLYAPDAGTVRLDGDAVTDDSRERYRQRFSAVFADFHLFKRLLGIAGDSREAAARDQLARLQLDRRVDVRDGAFTTLNLSQGQRKRLALAVSRLEGRDIYVFDEWAADQDQTFREHFYHVMLPDLREAGKTVFVISHDERYYGVADRILKLDLGRLVFDVRAGAVPDSVSAS